MSRNGWSRIRRRPRDPCHGGSSRAARRDRRGWGRELHHPRRRGREDGGPLGILRLSGRAIDPIEGADLDPIVRTTTSLDNILGVRASAIVRSTGSDNDIILEAREPGAAFNDVTLQFVDHNLLQAARGLQAGSEYAEYDTAARAPRPVSASQASTTT